jgi:hypothetical protein
MAPINGAGLATAGAVGEARKIVGTGERRQFSKSCNSKTQSATRAEPTCEVCGKVLVRKKAGRKRHFCSDQCRDAARRNRSFVGLVGKGAFFRGGGYPTQGNPRNAVAAIWFCRGIFGHFGDRAPVDPVLWRLIVEIELFGGLAWQPAISVDGVRCEIARFAPKKLNTAARTKAAELIAQIPADLSIPEFLRRLPPRGPEESERELITLGDALPIVGEGLSQTWRYIDAET